MAFALKALSGLSSGGTVAAGLPLTAAPPKNQGSWRRDGKELFYIAADRKLRAVDVKLGKTFEAGVPKTLFATRVLTLTGFRNHYAVTTAEADCTGPCLIRFSECGGRRAFKHAGARFARDPLKEQMRVIRKQTHSIHRKAVFPSNCHHIIEKPWGHRFIKKRCAELCYQQQVVVEHAKAVRQ